MLHSTHNAPSAGHQDIDKTLNCLQQGVGMEIAVENTVENV